MLTNEREGHAMWEQVAQMGPMLILAGLMAGWTAEALSRAGGYGLIPDMVVGLIGSVLTGGIIRVVVFHDPGMLGMLVIGCAGAGLAIVAQRGLWRSTRLGA
jgi:uncharacterized membrane protein YeaQ/YmgE (transglycosylase-associated protein family)